MTDELILHAGTHKTASTYIQARLRRNQELLSANQITYQFPEQDTTFKRLSKAIGKGDWSSWEHYLDHAHRPGQHLLVSAEQFGSQLTERRTIKALNRIAKQHDLKLRVVIFIRTQLDYINSRYTYSLKRFYHTETFKQYVEDVLKGQLPSTSAFAKSLRQRQDVFDFWAYFHALRRARRKGLSVNFLPFRQNGQDPFDQFLDFMSLPPGPEWKNCPEQAQNRSPGIRGTFLARELGVRLKQAGIPARRIENSSAVITAEEQFRRWDDPPFWGFSPELALRVSQHFEANNNRFAQEVWGCPWREVFPQDNAFLDRQPQVYSPSSERDRARMEAIADHLLRRLQRRLAPKPLDPLRDQAERLISRWT